ncbi:inositol 1,4,5-trisphosphate receptor-interacting protein-like 1 [Calonectris borealis]|uniref:inositol 1,4,5-trisphosphate receptor-interacting protein-like 1 n=1 Tax=Calonectris borealis TaxID=1323832 RepID=UPI003F4C0453
MAAIKFFALVVQSIIQLLQMVGVELDEAMRERMQQREEMLSREMTRLLQELEQSTREQSTQEQSTQEQSGFAWGALLFAALQQWQFWAIAGALVLLFGLCWWLKKRSCEPDSSSDEESSSSDREQVVEEEEEEEEEGGNGDVYDLQRFYDEHIQSPVQNLATECKEVKLLVDHFILVMEKLFSKSFFPVLQSAIGVGSAFEGWSPREEDIIYRLLVPLKSPQGHVFHLVQDTAGEMPARDFCIHVDLVCTCLNEQLAGEMLCFLHCPEEELSRKQEPSLLRTLCTGSYLDVQKTAHWLQDWLKDVWVVLPQSRKYRLTVLPSSRSCKFQVTNGNNRSLWIEMIFGVQQRDSDIFVSSRTLDTIFTPSIVWPESYTVAEVKFFRHVASHAPQDSVHLKCLQLCARILMCRGSSTYALKTAVMHLLTLSRWGSVSFVPGLLRIMRYLHHCLEEKRLNHFFFGNENVPEEIILPPAFQTADPLNLFQHLAQDPDAHAEAVREFMKLGDRLARVRGVPRDAFAGLIPDGR